jgi:hypothetical protein
MVTDPFGKFVEILNIIAFHNDPDVLIIGGLYESVNSFIEIGGFQELLFPKPFPQRFQIGKVNTLKSAYLIILL